MEKNASGSLKVRGRSSSMEITIVCVPFQVDVARWGCALGPQAFLDAGIAEQIEVRGHSIRKVVWIDLPKSERTRDSVTNLGRIAKRPRSSRSRGIAAASHCAYRCLAADAKRC